MYPRERALTLLAVVLFLAMTVYSFVSAAWVLGVIALALAALAVVALIRDWSIFGRFGPF